MKSRFILINALEIESAEEGRDPVFRVAENGKLVVHAIALNPDRINGWRTRLTKQRLGDQIVTVASIMLECVNGVTYAHVAGEAEVRKLVRDLCIGQEFDDEDTNQNEHQEG